MRLLMIDNYDSFVVRSLRDTALLAPSVWPSADQ